jgi:hypothetical protein
MLVLSAPPSRWLLAICVLAIASTAAVLVVPRSSPRPRLVRTPVPLLVPVVMPAKPAPASLVSPIDPSATWIPAYGTCTRPDRDAQAVIDARVRVWVDRAWKDVVPEEPITYYGCMDRGSIVVNALADAVYVHGERIARWWVLRLTDRAIEVLASARGASLLDSDAHAVSHQVDTFALADLDGDGRLEPIIERYDSGDDTRASQTDVLVLVGNRLRLVGHTEGYVRGAAMAHGKLVVDVESTSGRAQYCVGARGRWARCLADPPAPR